MSLATLKKGDTVILHMFTGIAVGVKEVLAADKATVTLETRIGTAKFSKKTGKQVSPAAKAPRFANFITEDDGSFVPTNGKKPEKSAAKKTKAKTKPTAEPADEETETEEDEAPVKPSKKTTAKKPVAKKAKKPAKPAPVEEDDDGFEEADDEEYEEE